MQRLWIACCGRREAGSSRARTGSVAKSNSEYPRLETDVDCPVFPLQVAFEGTHLCRPLQVASRKFCCQSVQVSIAEDCAD